ncbi:carboxylating nicotinate-nucleotide diphosphorylase [Dehalobacter sp. DCM]|uniref:carboxylating nicotinate-nucleotide diphosphorylase n=1 Tax=Dehalobacter sp. DCM TaxID=2907827 RepID=UPI003081CCCC|nr:carboxylating nicotinate-nucleotide diphosphorylase [Dehalobacter sp. DCM]
MFAMFQYDELIERALKEDIGTGDLSTLIIPEDYYGEARIYTKSNGIVCGLPIAELVFRKVNPAMDIETIACDGDRIKPGDLIMKIRGPLAAILQAERTVLNFIQHLSGIASITRRYVDAVKGTDTKITDTRKTMPGMRSLQKYAVRVGGGVNHRFGLYDGVMLKDNHLSALTNLTEAIPKLREKIGHMVKIEVECETMEQIEEALQSNVDVIMLDNMSLEDMRTAVKLIDHRTIVEASGGILEKNVRDIAETGVDFISIGRLTHSVEAVDFSMVIDDTKPSIKKYLTQDLKI